MRPMGKSRDRMASRARRARSFLRSVLTADSGLIAYKAGMLARLKDFLKDEFGATAIEYGLIAAGIAVAIIAVVNGLGTKLKTTFSSISTQLK